MIQLKTGVTLKKGNERQRNIFLTIFSVTEMWERYGFYIIQSLLALYLAYTLHLHEKETYKLVGTFTALSYISPVLGGWIADRYLGQKLAVLSGICVLFASYVCLSIYYLHLTELYISLSGMCLGTGLLKPNLSCLVGTLYQNYDSRKDGGFLIYYAVMAFGILLGTTIPSIILHLWGWQWAFFSPVIALFIALLVFCIGLSIYRVEDHYEIKSSRFKKMVSFLLMSIIWLGFFSLFYYSTLALYFFISVACISVLVMFLLFSREDTSLGRLNLISVMLMNIISVLFWMLYFQMFMSMTLFIYKCVQLKFLGIVMSPPYYVAIESLGLVLLGPLLSLLCKHYYHRIPAIDTAVKFMLSIFFMIFAFIVLFLSIWETPHLMLVNPWWIIVAYLFVSMAELLLSPVGLSMSAKLVKPQTTGLMLGIFFVTLGVGGYLAGLLSTLSAVSKNASMFLIKLRMLEMFKIDAMIACLIFVLALIFLKVIDKLFKQQLISQ